MNPAGAKGVAADAVTVAPPAPLNIRRPWGVVLSVSIVALLINLITLTRGPAVWQDEVMFADPAINLATGHGFRSTAWEQPQDLPFASNSPVYPLLLAGWIKGVSLVSTDAAISPFSLRLPNYLLMLATVLLIGLACWRFGIVHDRRAALMLTCLLWGGWATTFSYRSGRYDVLGMFWFAAMFLAATLRSRPSRCTAIALLAILLAPTGLQNLPCAAAMGAVLLVLTGRRWLGEIAALGFGSAIGLVMLLGTLHVMGLLPVFVQSVAGLAKSEYTLSSRIGWAIYTTYKGDISTAVLVVTSVIAIWLSGRGAPARPWLQATIALGLSVPFMVALTGKFPVYYGWMSLLPVAVCVSRAYELSPRSAGAGRVRAVLAVGAVAASLFLPVRQLFIVGEWHARDYRRVEQFVAAVVKPADHVACSFSGYYPAKRIARSVSVLTHFNAMTTEQRERIDLLVVHPDDEAYVRSKIGGEWVETARLTTPAERDSIVTVYDLKAFRRVPRPIYASAGPTRVR